MDIDPSCKFMNLDRPFTVENLAAFHGHLGPYIVIGYRIGRYAREHFCTNPFELKARVFCAGTPPESCLADGVQIGSGCTLGKQNIEIVESEQIAIEFENGDRTIRLTPLSFELPDHHDEDGERAIEIAAEAMYHLDSHDLFTVEER
ncbi:formylmethanofuran dehydrogenase [Methanofollis formosanus]|uniref:Formylmethanofuran dehydrogenase n=1 Tax=Methanofollis formosanus TaxID=299308 RepID=A0A8G1A191_9EURY|nr:formylmethanofuran dehydrogenase subunit E family protein [Methanofollis formosanus]QYZ79327.1 formylmethanofuran dehydrogenase [Methanofollis formosanus]